MYRRFFEHIEVDQAWAARVREAEARGTVLYVLRNLSFVDFLALDYLTKSLGLPEIRFANDLGLWLLEPMGRGWVSALTSHNRTGEHHDSRDAGRLRRTIDDGHSAALFLKRPPSLLEEGAVARERGGEVRALPTRGRREGDALLRAVLEAQRGRSKPILLVPQVFVWSRSPDEQKHNAVDALFGPREWPGKARTVMQFLANWRHVTLRAGEPLDVQAFLEQETRSVTPDEAGAATVEGRPPESATEDGIADSRLVRRLTYALLRRLERERRGVLGPARKPPDRQRNQVIRSPRLQKVIRDMAGDGPREQRVLGFRAVAMLRELEASVDPNAIRAIDAVIDQTVARMYSTFEVDEPGLERVRQAAKDGSLVLLPSHKSHLDYIVLSRVFHRANMPVPLVAAGDNLAFFPLGPVLRRAGAFFIRRNFRGDRLYGAVVDAYLRRLLKDGWPLEIFLEGGRSRTGKLLPPKLGLLSILVDAVLGAPNPAEEKRYRKVTFVPVSIGYERLVEEHAYVEELSGGEKKREDVGGLFRAAQTIFGHYGRLNVQFGDLLTVDGVRAELGESTGPLTPPRRRALIARLAYRAMNEVNRVTAVTPIALVATALLTHTNRGMTHACLVESCERIAGFLGGEGARFSTSLLAHCGTGVFTPRHDALREACELLLRVGHVEVLRHGEVVRSIPRTSSDRAARVHPDATYVVPELKRIPLDIAKNLIVHFFVSRAMIAIPLAAAARLGAPSLASAQLAERVQTLSRLFKHEFQFRADATFETIFTETLGAMEADGELQLDREGNVSLPTKGEGFERATLHVRVLRTFVEGYRVAARGLLALLKNPALPKDLTKRTLATGERMVLAGEIECRESVSRPLIENAFLAFVDQGYLARSEGRYVLPESYATADAVRTIESRIASYL